MHVNFFGDSLFQQSANYFAWYCTVRGFTHTMYAHGGTAACDWFDDINVLTHLNVFGFGGNMLTPCTQNRGSQQQVYEEDMHTCAAISVYLGIPAIMVVAPGNTGTSEFSNWRIPILYDIVAEYGAYGIRYLNASDVLRRGIYSVYEQWFQCQSEDYGGGLCNPFGWAKVRSDDGIHLEPSGQRRYAQRIVNAI